jgi:phospholipid/cholesterol/gamma-HCH transport system ATP-binding protein
MTTPVIEVHGLWTAFGAQVIHRNIDFVVQKGEIIAIIGGSGSGKTTFLRELLGLLQPQKGSVRILGEDWRHLDDEKEKKLRRRQGVLFQNGALFSALTVYDNIAFPLRELRTYPEKAIQALVFFHLEQVGLKADDAPKLPAELSGGMVKRVALARALATEPELLFLDEPTSGLDPLTGRAFAKLIARLRQLLGLTVVMISHDLETIKSLCDRVAVLGDKTLLAMGSIEVVRKNPHPFIQGFFN